MTLAEFIAAHELRMTAVRTSRNPNIITDNAWAQDADHWICTVFCGPDYGAPHMCVYYSMGKGHNGAEPTLPDVLGCLASDTASVEDCDGFEAWADAFGFDTDSRKAELTYDIVCEQSAELRVLLGDDAYVSLLQVDRD